MKIAEEKTSGIVFKQRSTYSITLNKTIKGQIKEKETPLPCLVRLFEKASGVLFSETLTDDQGNYCFYNLTDNEFFYIVAHHPTLKYNAVIQDNVVPK